MSESKISRGDFKETWESYDNYKDSDVIWLSQIPSHWERTFIKHTSTKSYKSFVDGDWIESPYITDEGIRLLQTGNIGIGIYKEQGYRYISDEAFNDLDCTEVFPNDILICRLAAPVGRACLAPDIGVRMITSVDVCILKPNENYVSKYLVYFFSCQPYLEWLDALARGSTRSRISRTMLGDIEILSPPTEEQHAIATFLDHETAKIDTLIDKKQRLIDLLKEQRSAIISHTVTKGLDPDVPMKDSGIEWLGEIPVHWNDTRIKYVSSLKGRLGWQNLRSEEYTDEGPYVVSSAHFDNKKIVWDKCPHVTYERYLIDENIQLAENDVLMMKDGAAMGKLAFVDHLPDLACLNSHLLLFRPIGNDSPAYIPKFMFYLLDSKQFQHYILQYGTGSTFLGISQQSIGNYEMFLPSIEEQMVIADYIDAQTKHLDRLIQRITNSIQQQLEYRSALISSAVTGKIDVRDEVKAYE